MDIFLIGCLAIGGVLLAHQGHEHQQLLGTIERLRDCHLVLKTQEGEIKAIFLSPTMAVQHKGDAAALLKRCAEACRKCAESCRKMARAA